VAKLSDLEIDVEDTADLLLRFKSGALGAIHLDMVDRVPVRRCRVVGTDGSIDLDFDDNEAFMQAPNHAGRESLGAPDFWNGPDAQPHYLEMRHFLACCRGEAQPPVDGRDAARTLAVLMAAKRSAEERMEVRLG
jgi:predicted dehydrogenase